MTNNNTGYDPTFLDSLDDTDVYPIKKQSIKDRFEEFVNRLKEKRNADKVINKHVDKLYTLFGDSVAKRTNTPKFATKMGFKPIVRWFREVSKANLGFISEDLEISAVKTAREAQEFRKSYRKIKLDETIFGEAKIGEKTYKVTKGAYSKAHEWLTSGDGRELSGKFIIKETNKNEFLIHNFEPGDAINVSSKALQFQGVVDPFQNVHYHPHDLTEPSYIDFQNFGSKTGFIMTDNGLSVYGKDGSFGYGYSYAMLVGNKKTTSDLMPWEDLVTGKGQETAFNKHSLGRLIDGESKVAREFKARLQLNSKNIWSTIESDTDKLKLFTQRTNEFEKLVSDASYFGGTIEEFVDLHGDRAIQLINDIHLAPSHIKMEFISRQKERNAEKATSSTTTEHYPTVINDVADSSNVQGISGVIGNSHNNSNKSEVKSEQTITKGTEEVPPIVETTAQELKATENLTIDNKTIVEKYRDIVSERLGIKPNEAANRINEMLEHAKKNSGIPGSIPYDTTVSVVKSVKEREAFISRYNKEVLDQNILTEALLNGKKYQITEGAYNKAKDWLTSGNGKELTGTLLSREISPGNILYYDFDPKVSLNVASKLGGFQFVEADHGFNIHYHPFNITSPSVFDYAKSRSNPEFIVTDNGSLVFYSGKGGNITDHDILIGKSKTLAERTETEDLSTGQIISSQEAADIHTKRNQYHKEKTQSIESEIVDNVQSTVKAEEIQSPAEAKLTETPLESTQKATDEALDKIKEIRNKNNKPEAPTQSTDARPPYIEPSKPSGKAPGSGKTEGKATVKEGKGFLGKYGTAIGLGILAISAIAALKNRDDDSSIREEGAEENNPGGLHHRAKEALHRFHKYKGGSFKRSSYDSDSNRSHAVVGAIAGATAFGIKGQELFSNLAKRENILKGNNPALFGKAFNSAETAWGIATGVSKITRSNNAQDRVSGVADIVNAAFVPSAANRIVEAVAGKTKAGVGIEMAKLGVQFGLAGATSYMARHLGMAIDKKGNKGYSNPTMEYKPTPDQNTDAIAAHDSPGDFAMSMVTRDLPMARKEVDKKLHHLINNGYAY